MGAAVVDMRVAGDVGGVGNALAAGFDDKEVALAPGVLGAVNLGLSVADKARLETPLGGVGTTGPGEIVGPNHLPRARGRAGPKPAHLLGAGQRGEKE